MAKEKSKLRLIERKEFLGDKLQGILLEGPQWEKEDLLGYCKVKIY